MADEIQSKLNASIEPIIATMARLFAAEGGAREVAVLANAEGMLRYLDEDWGTTFYCLHLQIPSWLYSQLADNRENCERHIEVKANLVSRPFSGEFIRAISIDPLIKADDNWRDKAKKWLVGDGVNNQGRVRSNNIASKTTDGLLFRSQNEIFLYKALKSLGVSFAPLPVFVRGGETYRRIEPDFVIIKSGVVLVVEVDGDTVHHETPAEATDRTRMLAHEGVHIERVKASECATQDLANDCAKKIVQIIDKLKAAR
jgi:hypothetical protein